MNLFYKTDNKLMGIENKYVVPKGEREGGDKLGVLDQQIQTTIYKTSYKDIVQQGDYSLYFIIILNGV